jgi:hypothetical protein
MYDAVVTRYNIVRTPLNDKTRLHENVIRLLLWRLHDWAKNRALLMPVVHSVAIHPSRQARYQFILIFSNLASYKKVASIL